MAAWKSRKLDQTRVTGLGVILKTKDTASSRNAWARASLPVPVAEP